MRGSISLVGGALIVAVAWAVGSAAPAKPVNGQFIYIPPSANTITAASCGLTDVQTAVDASIDGQIVAIPAGSCTWTSTLVLDNKNIYLRGAGIDQTTITHNATGNTLTFQIAMSSSSRGKFRVSGMTILGTTDGVVFNVTSEGYNGVVANRWRIDHIKLAYASGQRTGIAVRGVNYGLVDHWEASPWRAGILIRTVQFVAADYTGSGIGGDLINSQPLDYGTDNFVFVEDSTFTFDWTEGNSVLYDSSAGGGRVVLRYLTAANTLIYNHWTRNTDLSGEVMEVYSNTLTGSASAGGWNAYVAQIEAGTGVVYNNQVTGYTGTPYVWLTERRGAGEEVAPTLLDCNGSRAWDGNIEATGWPCFGQIGRAPGKSFAAIVGGDKQTSSPFHMWNNGPESACKTGGSCTDTVTIYNNGQNTLIKATPHTNGDVDYILGGNTPKAGYSAYQYPHPRQTATWPY